jgi:phosphopantothenoylcysteine synthetase/decarboxylase
VPIDAVRVISNRATGKTGALLASRLAAKGHSVTLLAGPNVAPIKANRVKVIPFLFFEELECLLKKELRSRRYAVLIHAAAVADYRLKKIFKGKFSSAKQGLLLRLVPTPKLINSVKKNDPAIRLVAFKYEPLASRALLINEARRLIRKTGAEIVVANTQHKNTYAAYLVTPQCVSEKIDNKNALASELIKLLNL